MKNIPVILLTIAFAIATYFKVEGMLNAFYAFTLILTLLRVFVLVFVPSEKLYIDLNEKNNLPNKIHYFNAVAVFTILSFNGWIVLSIFHAVVSLLWYVNLIAVKDKITKEKKNENS